MAWGAATEGAGEEAMMIFAVGAVMAMLSIGSGEWQAMEMFERMGDSGV